MLPFVVGPGDVLRRLCRGLAAFCHYLEANTAAVGRNTAADDVGSRTIGKLQKHAR
jgi:hypothetical protein